MLVSVAHPQARAAELEFDRQEFAALAQAAGAEILGHFECRLRRPNAATLIGSGKVEEIAAFVQSTDIQIALFNAEITPSQERNLEQRLCCRVIGRTGVILDIFAQRARTYEGRLQVELAQLEHLSTRLVRGWTHLERQRGGIGVRGPGESQLETDRRLLGRRMSQLRSKLDRIANSRAVGRRARSVSPQPLIALIGYTNAGKSTLFNAVSGSIQQAEDALFVTLDAKLKRIRNPSGLDAVMVDTVGFVSNLPHELIDAFAATLEETRQADVLLHVLDASSPHCEAMRASVDEVLERIGACEVPQLLVHNKIDRTGERPRIEYQPDGPACSVWLSAGSGVGLDLLDEALGSLLQRDWVRRSIRLQPGCGEARAWLYDRNAVESEALGEDGLLHLDVRLSRRHWHQFERLHEASRTHSAPPFQDGGAC